MRLERPGAEGCGGVGGGELSAEGDTRWTWLIKKAGDVCLGGVSDGAGDFSESPVIVGSAGAFRDGASRKGQRKQREGNENASGSDETP